ncbi:MAG: tRNA 4-thiouridine(8) synthase ThiI [Clostridia bacterium]|nr:tRNA 4-thiouridine(8) synthase ThiI [Clostridia bacterium]
MEKVILIRYCEIHLKGKNRSFFENLLLNNIKTALKNFNLKVTKTPARYIVSEFNENDESEIIEILKCIPGIFSFSRATKIKTDLHEIEKLSIALMQDKKGTFKVNTNRADKTVALNSMEISREIGGKILASNKNLTVDVHEPNFSVSIDIRENGETFVFTDSILGVGGMPVGSSGKALLLLSGGIDSPVAGYMMAKRGTEISAVHFHSFPFTSPEAKEKVITLANKLKKYAGKINLYVVSVTNIQKEIHKNCHESYMITLLRRCMFKIAERLCKEKGLDMIVTGESLGQVASQTIESIKVVESVVESTPVLRPLIAFDKNETILISKKIDTFKTSTLPFEDCCTVFLPDAPIIKPKLEKVLIEESKIDAENLIKEAMQNIELIEI